MTVDVFAYVISQAPVPWPIGRVEVEISPEDHAGLVENREVDRRFTATARSSGIRFFTYVFGGTHFEFNVSDQIDNNVLAFSPTIAGRIIASVEYT